MPSQIKVYFNKDWESKMGVFIELRGQGAVKEEYMESNVNNCNLMKRISECHSKSLTRLDIANDIFDDKAYPSRL